MERFVPTLLIIGILYYLFCSPVWQHELAARKLKRSKKASALSGADNLMDKTAVEKEHDQNSQQRFESYLERTS